MQNITLYTPRLFLKAITPASINQLFCTHHPEEIMRLLGIDNVAYKKFEAMHQNGMETHNISMYYFILHNKQTNLPIGECGFHTWNKAHRRAELFYKLHNDDDKRKGYVTEALDEVINFGFTQLNLHRIEALVANYNIPSVKLLLRYGFTKEGILREHYDVDGKHEDSDCYSLLEHEWR